MELLLRADGQKVHELKISEIKMSSRINFILRSEPCAGSSSLHQNKRTGFPATFLQARFLQKFLSTCTKEKKVICLLFEEFKKFKGFMKKMLVTLDYEIAHEDVELSACRDALGE